MLSLWFSNEYREDLSADKKIRTCYSWKSLFHKENQVQGRVDTLV